MGFSALPTPSPHRAALLVRGSRVELRPLRGLAPLDRLPRSPALRAGRVKSRRPDSLKIKPYSDFGCGAFSSTAPRVVSSVVSPPTKSNTVSAYGPHPPAPSPFG